MKFLSILFVVALLGSPLFSASLTVSKETILKESPSTDSKTLLIVKAGETGPAIEAYGDYSYITTDSAVKLAINGKFAKEGWVFRELFVWQGDIGTAKVDSAISAGPYMAGHDNLSGAVPKNGTVKHIRYDEWWQKTTIRGTTGWLFRGTFSVAK